RIDKRLAHIAGKQGRSVHDLEEDALPDFGIGPGGWAEIGIGDARAVIALATGGVALNWFGAGGAPRKSVPASVRRDCKAELNALRRRVGYIRAARSAQVARLEDAWLEDRSWPLSTWRRRFLDHPLRRPLASALIWRFESAAGRLDA